MKYLVMALLISGCASTKYAVVACEPGQMVGKHYVAKTTAQMVNEALFVRKCKDEPTEVRIVK